MGTLLGYIFGFIWGIVKWVISEIQYEDKKNTEKLQNEQQILINASKTVTHFCYSCGILIHSNAASPRCPLCNAGLRKARGEDVLIGECVQYKKPNEEAGYMWYVQADDLFKSGKYNELFELIKQNDENDPIAQYYIGMIYKNTDIPAYLQHIRRSAEQGHPLALFELGLAYYQNRGIEKNNVLAQKYMEQAAQKNYGLAYYYITKLCLRSEFMWSKTVKNATEGYFKSSIKGNLCSIQELYPRHKYYHFHTEMYSSIPDNLQPSVVECRLWWAIRAAELGDANAVNTIEDDCRLLIENIEPLRNNSQINKLYLEYSELLKYWKKQEPRLKYPDKDCYTAYLAEQNKDFEKALEFYKRAAERNVQQGIEAVRRLTGNKNYKLKTGKLHTADYHEAYQKAHTLLQNGDYDYCLVQARKTLEIVIHNLYYDHKIDIPNNDDLSNLIEELYRLKVIDRNVNFKILVFSLKFLKTGI